MSEVGPMGRLAAVELAMERAPVAARGDDLTVAATWLAETARALKHAGVAEVGFAACCLASVELHMGGALARDEDGRNVRYQQRVSSARSLQADMVMSLQKAQLRLAKCVRPYEAIAEQAIRAAAEAQVLAAPDGGLHQEWLAEMARRMAMHPKSASHLVRLEIALPAAEVLAVLDRVFRNVFGVAG